MRNHNVEILLPYSIQELYTLVTDIENYPEFLPWCKAACIIEKSDEAMIAELVISFKGFCEKYRSKITLQPPKNKKATIDVVAISGPFSHLLNTWELTYYKKNITKVKFALDFQFKSFLLNGIVGIIFSDAADRMITAFQNRALYLYGKHHGLEQIEKHR